MCFPLSFRIFVVDVSVLLHYFPYMFNSIVFVHICFSLIFVHVPAFVFVNAHLTSFPSFPDLRTRPVLSRHNVRRVRSCLSVRLRVHPSVRLPVCVRICRRDISW